MERTQLLSLANAYSAHTALKLTTLGAYAVNDGKFFARLEDGGECMPRTAKKVMRWFSEVWPEDLAWPRDIPRPAKSKAAA